MHGVFHALSTYSGAEPENYLTESLVYVLRLMQERQPDALLRVLNRLVAFPREDLFTDASRVGIRTQTVLDDGRPDMEIVEGARVRAFVEVKHDSPLHPNQLEGYLRHLQASPHDVKQLVLLTRSRAAAVNTTLSAADFRHVCWYEVYDWLAEWGSGDEIVRHMVADFQCFLRDKEMCMEKVSWEYENGVAALLRLTSMLEVAAREAIPDCAVRRTAGWLWRGLFLQSEYFLGVRYDDPMMLVFENNLGTKPTARRELDLASTHFLALTKAEQLEAVTVFVRDSAAMVLPGPGRVVEASVSGGESEGDDILP